MDAFGSIDVRIYNENDGFCEILTLDSSDNNFENGDLDVFYVDDLKNCFLFYIPDNNSNNVVNKECIDPPPNEEERRAGFCQRTISDGRQRLICTT